MKTKNYKKVWLALAVQRILQISPQRNSNKLSFSRNFLTHMGI